MDASQAPSGTEPTAAAHARRWLDLLVPVLLGAFVAWATWTALAPSSVWIDDAWVVLAAKADSPSQLVQTIITAHGFMVLLWGWLNTVGTAGLGGAAPQVLPLVFGVAAPGALWLALRRWCHWDVAPALVAAGLVATSPLVITFSTRVKQYTLDVLLAALLTAGAIGLSHHFSARRRVWLTVGACAAIVMSAATASVAGAAVVVAWGVAAAARTQDQTAAAIRWPDAKATAAPFLAFLGFALVWQVGVLSHTVPEGMYTFWRAQFLPVADGPAAVALATRDGLWDVVGATIALPVALVLALAAIGIWRNRWTCTPIGLMVVLPVLASIGLALLQRAPWGGGRTDSHLVVALAIGVGSAFAGRPDGEKHGERRTFLRGGVPQVVVGVVLLAFAATNVERPVYPQEDLRPLVGQLEVGIGDDELILVYPFARLAYAVYASGDVTFKPNEGSSVGYAIDINDPRVVFLPGWRRDPTQYAPIVADLTSDTCGVWLPASHISIDLPDVKHALAAAGFAQLGPAIEAAGAELTHWTKETSC